MWHTKNTHMLLHVEHISEGFQKRTEFYFWFIISWHVAYVARGVGGKEERKPHAPRVQHTATGHRAFAFVIAFAFVFFPCFPDCFSSRVSAESVNIGIMSEHRFHYKVQFTLSSWSPLPFLFAASSSFCCFRCCNCITRLKARTFWVNSHSRSHSTHTDTDTSTYTVTVRYFLSWGFLFVAAKTSKQNKRRQPKKCIKKTKTEEIQKKTLDSSTQHTTLHIHTGIHTQKHQHRHREITSLRPNTLTPHRTPQATANEDVQCSTDSRGMRHDPLTSCCLGSRWVKLSASCICVYLSASVWVFESGAWSRVCECECVCARSLLYGLTEGA